MFVFQNRPAAARLLVVLLCGMCSVSANSAGIPEPTAAAIRLMQPSERGNESLIQSLKKGRNLKGMDLRAFRGTLMRLNHAVGPIVPTRRNPVVPGKNKLVDAIISLETQFNQNLPASEIVALPAAADFPGNVPRGSKPVSRTIPIDGGFKGWDIGRPFGGPLSAEQRPTGLYAAPGTPIRISVPDEMVGKGYTVTIGSYGGGLRNRDKWFRYPRIQRKVALDSKTVHAANGFGGIVTIGVPSSAAKMVGKTFNVGISGAIEAPLYIHGVTDLKLWQTRIRKLPAPYAELVSERMIITLPSEYIRDLDRPDQVMDLWNQMVEKCAELACIDINEYRAARITFERQIANGGLHSGYPIGAHIGKNAEEAVDVESLRKTGNWGFLHEFGHNHQHRPWLLPNTTETTCNLWSVYVSEELFGVSRNDAHREGNRKAREDRMVDYFKRGAPFKEEWAGWTALESYLQIQESFGWEVYKKVFTEYNAYPQGKGPKVDQARYDEWVRKMSRACGVNLVPFYQTWGMPISPSVAGELQTLPEWKQDPVARFRGLNEVRTSL